MATTHSTAAVRPAPSSPPAWELTAERGPDWLFVRVGGAAAEATAKLTETIWEMIREHHASRVVLELDGVDHPDRALWDSIAELGSRMRDSGGLIRISGLSPGDRQASAQSGAVAGVPCFASRTAAVGTRACPEGRCE